jgi:hypothetical protein
VRQAAQQTCNGQKYQLHIMAFDFGAALPSGAAGLGAAATNPAVGGNVFGINADATGGANIFGGVGVPAATQAPAANIFGVPTTTAAAANPFGAPATTTAAAANPFGAPATTTAAAANPFGAPATTTAAAAANPFGGGDAFGAAANPFGSTSAFGNAFGAAAAPAPLSGAGGASLGVTRSGPRTKTIQLGKVGSTSQTEAHNGVPDNEPLPADLRAMVDDFRAMVASEETDKDVRSYGADRAGRLRSFWHRFSSPKIGFHFCFFEGRVEFLPRHDCMIAWLHDCMIA